VAKIEAPAVSAHVHPTETPALDRLGDEYTGLIYRLAPQASRDPLEAEDLFQDSYRRPRHPQVPAMVSHGLAPCLPAGAGRHASGETAAHSGTSCAGERATALVRRARAYGRSA
jgi:hypothetical protein